MTKIIQLITRLDKGGSADLVLQTCALQVSNGYEVLLISGKTIEPQFNIEKFSQENGFRIYFVNYLVRNINPFADLFALIQLTGVLRKEKPDILHTNTSKAGFIGRIAGKLAGIKKIYHSPHGHIFYGYYSKPVTNFFIFMEKFATRFTTKVFNLTEKGKQDHINEGIGEPEKFVVSSCGVDLHNFQNFQPKSFPDKEITILWIGRFVPIKNPEMVLNVAKHLDSDRYRFIMVGDGEMFEDIKSKSTNHKNIEFSGYNEDLLPLLEKSDIFIITSLNEGFGRVIVEAMAAGLPVIATDVGGISEIISDCKNGYLVNSNDSKFMAGCIENICSNRELYKKMSSNNLLDSKQYSMENYVNNIVREYNK